MNIVNMYKEDSMYNYGKKPFVFSTKSNSLEGKKWKRDCFNISYFRNSKTLAASKLQTDDPIYNINSDKSEVKYKQLSTLQFSYTFEYHKDIVYFAHFVPYTYSHLA